MADYSKFLSLVAGIHKSINLNGGSDILKVSSIKIGASSSEITDAIAQKLVLIGAIADGASGADQVGATVVGGGSSNTVQGILEEIDSDVDTLESSMSSAETDIDDLEAAVGSTTGVSGMTYSSVNYVTSGESAKLAIGDLDSQVKTNADAISGLSSSTYFKGVFDASSMGSQLDDADLGDTWVVSVAGTILTSLELNVGDHLVCVVDVTGTPTLASSFSKIDNTEASDILRSGDLSSAKIFLGNASNIASAVSVSGDISISNTGVVSISSDSIVNADINSSAAIALSKLASGSSAQLVVCNASGVPTYASISGDISISNAGVVSIGSTKVTNDMLAGSIADSKLVEDYIKTSEVDGSTIEFSGGSLNVKASGITESQLNNINGDIDAQSFVLTSGYASSAGTIAAGDTIEAAVQKLDARSSVSDAENVFVNLTNNTGVAISQFDLVALSTTVAGEVVLADSDALATSEGFVGVAMEAIADGASGKVQVSGEIQVNNGGVSFDLGKNVYLSATAGQASKTAVSAGFHLRVGKASAVNKIILSIGDVIEL